MKIRSFELFHVQPRFLLLKIETDTGLIGWGEPTLEGRSRSVAVAVAELMEMLVGEDPRQIEHHWQRMYRGGFYRAGAVLYSAMSGIEMALWDILGKSLNAPVWQLLGGKVRDRVRMYGQIHADSPGGYVEQYRRRRAEGLTAFKLGPWGATRIVDSPAVVEYAVACLEALRKDAGSDIEFALDAHGRLSPAMAIRMAKALEPFHPMFLEEPCLPENVDTMVTVARSTSIPIASGERLFTRWGFRELIEKQAAAVIQPDLSHTGGILESRKIAAMAEVYYAACAPHCPLSAVSLAACLQLDACLPNFLVQEHVTLGEDILVEPFVIEDGYIEVTCKPGLGIEVDEKKARALSYDGAWHTPELRHGDGSIADW
jgi:galactonate dehydratase